MGADHGLLSQGALGFRETLTYSNIRAILLVQVMHRQVLVALSCLIAQPDVAELCPEWPRILLETMWIKEIVDNMIGNDRAEERCDRDEDADNQSSLFGLVNQGRYDRRHDLDRSTVAGQGADSHQARRLRAGKLAKSCRGRVGNVPSPFIGVDRVDHADQ